MYIFAASFFAHTQSICSLTVFTTFAKHIETNSSDMDREREKERDAQREKIVIQNVKKKYRMNCNHIVIALNEFSIK